MFERPQQGEQAILVHLDFPEKYENGDFEEFKLLAVAAGAIILHCLTGKRDIPHPKYFIGSGKAEELQQIVASSKAELVIFNHDLSPGQERNLEKLLNARVLDRTGLILDIFAQRARSFEGKLQVELAQLEHLSTRLIRGWTHLERQKGGIGLRGPGEKQLESDRRLLRERINTIISRLNKVRRQRQQGRQARKKHSVPVVALVGYTNAGKSTLFNALTGGDVYVADQLFATLDPTLRRVVLPGIGDAIFADTVGFIRNLPHNLIDAFRATLEETLQADLLLHVIDISDKDSNIYQQQVNLVLEEIGASKVPQLVVYNKIDCLSEVEPRVQLDEVNRPETVWVSAAKNQGMDILLQAISNSLKFTVIHVTVKLNPQQAALRAALYAMQAVISEKTTDAGDVTLELKIDKETYLRLCEKHGVVTAQ